MKILLLEDDFSLNKVITNFLKSSGYFVDSCTNGDEAAKRMLKAQYDLCIFDINVPYIDGHDVLAYIRKENISTPVIMMSAMIDMDTIKRSYKNGCDDYLKKPFDIEELSLRINYILKQSSPEKKELIQLKYGYFFDLQKEVLSKNDITIDLSIKEKLMLSLFVQNIGNLVTIQMLQDYVWNGEEIESVSMRTIIHKLKSKLKSGMIINLRGVGYKLLSE